jgi:hypothetical protein
MTKTVKKLSVVDILKEKEKFQIKEDVKDEFYIERLDASIVIEKPSRSLCLDSMKMAHDPNKAENADAFLVYNVVIEPNLKDKELQQAFGCVEPMDIVSKIFEVGEIPQIAGTAMKMAGYHSEIKAVKDLKN